MHWFITEISIREIDEARNEESKYISRYKSSGHYCSNKSMFKYELIA